MPNQSLSKRQSPEEFELEAKRIELSGLSEILANKELQLADLKTSLSAFQHRYFHAAGRKYVMKQSNWNRRL